MSGNSRPVVPLGQHLRELHIGVLAGDRSSCDELLQLMLPLLGLQLRRRWPRVDPATIHDAAEDALLKYVDQPTVYDSSRSPLDRYLRLEAMSNLKDSFRRHERRLRHEVPIGDDWPEVAAEDVSRRPGRWRNVRALLRVAETRQEHAFLHAKLRGERRAATLAGILCLDHLSVVEQRAEVHRTWMRLLMRIRRSCHRSGE